MKEQDYRHIHPVNFFMNTKQYLCKYFKIKTKMLSCCVCREMCQGTRTLFRFPRDQRQVFQWMSKLGMTEFPGPSARICSLHFSPCDFLQNGRTIMLRDGSMPLSLVRIEIYPSYETANHMEKSSA